MTTIHGGPGRALCAIMLAALVESAGAATIKVPQDQPTPQAAVDAAVDGDTIIVAKGTYPPFAIVGRTGLQVQGKGKPVIDATGQAIGLLIESSSNVLIQGLVVRGSTDRAVGITSSSDVVFQKNAVERTENDGIRAVESTGVVIQKNTLSVIGNDGIDTSDDGVLGPSNNCLIAKNKVFGAEDDAIEIEGSGHRVEKNKLDSLVEDGIVLADDATGVIVAKNKITNADQAGINCNADGNTIEKNTVRDGGADSDGIRVDGDMNAVVRNKIAGGHEGIAARGVANRYEANTITRVNEDGFDVEADDSTFVGNKISKAAQRGIDIEDNPSLPGLGTGNLFERNKITKSGEYGIQVRTGENTFRSNKASKSGLVDLRDASMTGTNVYEDNKFKTEEIL